MTKLKVAIIGPAWPLRGGLSTYNERLAKQFIKEGHSCDLISFKLQYPKLLFPGKTQYSDDPKPAELNVISLINSINPINWILSGLKIKKSNYDLVIYRYWMPFMAPAFGTIARIIKWNKKTKLVTIADNIHPHEKHFYDQFCTNYFIPKIDGFVTMSEKVLADLRALTKVKSMYIPHPMYDNFGDPLEKQTAKLKLKLDPNYHYLLFFGFIRAYKGLDLMIKSMAESSLQDMPIKLLVAGEFYEDSEPYFSLIKTLNLENKIEMHTHFIPNSEVTNYFSACDMVVQTYHNATQSGVTQIAYHFNKPMLVTDVGGLAETVPHLQVGYVVDKDPKQIAAYIRHFYDEKKEEEFSQKASEYKQKFSWENIVKGLMEVAN